MFAREDKETILLLTDNSAEISSLVASLSSLFRVLVVKSRDKAHKILAKVDSPTLFLVEAAKPVELLTDINQKILVDPLIDEVSLVVISDQHSLNAEERCFELGAADFMTRPLAASILIARIQNQLALLSQRRQLQDLVSLRTHQLQQSKRKLIHCLATVSEYRDDESALHTQRIARYSEIIAEGFGANQDWCETIFYASPLHDIGKIALPDTILNNMGSLDGEAKMLMHTHTSVGACILNDPDEPLLVMAANIAQCHHERYDGSGYPAGLRGDDIPLEARIVALADSFDALQTKRSYREASSLEDTVLFINNSAGRLFDPHLVNVFNRQLPQLMRVREEVGED